MVLKSQYIIISKKNNVHKFIYNHVDFNEMEWCAFVEIVNCVTESEYIFSHTISRLVIKKKVALNVCLACKDINKIRRKLVQLYNDLYLFIKYTIFCLSIMMEYQNVYKSVLNIHRYK